MPLSLFDVVHIGLRVEQVVPEKASFEQRYAVWSERFDAIAAEGGAKLVLCDFNAQGKRAKGLSHADMRGWLGE